MVQLFQHPPFSHDVPHALRSNDYGACMSVYLCVFGAVLLSRGLQKLEGGWRAPTLIFPDVLQREGQPGILPLHDSDLAKCTFAYDAQQSEVVEVYCGRESCQSRRITTTHWSILADDAARSKGASPSALARSWNCIKKFPSRWVK